MLVENNQNFNFMQIKSISSGLEFIIYLKLWLIIIINLWIDFIQSVQLYNPVKNPYMCLVFVPTLWVSQNESYSSIKLYGNIYS